MTLSKHSLILVSAVAAALAAPIAFAQDAHAGMAAQAQTATHGVATPPVTPTTPAPEVSGAVSTSGNAATTSDDASAMGSASTNTATPTTSDSSMSAGSSSMDSGGASMSGKLSWSQLDADKDGNLSKAEATGAKSLSKVFDKADANKDGMLSADEYKSYEAGKQH